MRWSSQPDDQFRYDPLAVTRSRNRGPAWISLSAESDHWCRSAGRVVVRPVSFALPKVASFDRPLWGWRRSIAPCFKKPPATLREGHSYCDWCYRNTRSQKERYRSADGCFLPSRLHSHLLVIRVKRSARGLAWTQWATAARAARARPGRDGWSSPGLSRPRGPHATGACSSEDCSTPKSQRRLQ